MFAHSVVESLEGRRLFAAGGLGNELDRFGTPVQPGDLVTENPTPTPTPTPGPTTPTPTPTAPSPTPTPTPTTPTPTTPTPTTPTPTTPTPTPTTPTPTTPTPTAPTPTPTPSALPSPTVGNDGTDQLSEARSITIGGTRTDTISSDTDVDMLKITLRAGDVVGFDLDNVVNNLTFDGFLRVFDSTGEELANSDDDEGPDPEPSDLEPFIEFTAETSGTYFLGVSGVGNETYDAVTGADDELGAFGSYMIRTSLIAKADSDDQIGEAESIGNDDTDDGSLATLTDVDMYRLNARAGQRFLIDANPRNSSGVSLLVRVFNASGEEIAISTTPASPFIAFVAPTNGNFYIGVSGDLNVDYNPFTGALADDTPGTNVGSYRLKIDRV